VPAQIRDPLAAIQEGRPVRLVAVVSAVDVLDPQSLVLGAAAPGALLGAEAGWREGAPEQVP
jgi:hypothetical protein